MNEVLLGFEDRKIEGKSRITIPKKFDAKEGDTLVFILEEDYFEAKEYGVVLREIERLIQRKNSCNKKEAIKYFENKKNEITSSLADIVTVDNQSRVNINKFLLEKYDLTDEVVIEGIYDGFRVWNPEKFYDYQKANISRKSRR